MVRIVRLLVFVFALLSTSLFARTAAAAPERTTVGVYIEQVTSLDLKGSTFTVDFWIWFRHAPRGGASPIDTFELIGGRVNSKTNLIKKTLPDGNLYASARVNATIQRVWDLRRYPFDRHALEIVIEDSELDDAKSVFVSDPTSQGKDAAVQLSGWDIDGFGSEVTSHRYPSNYGDSTVAVGSEASFSRYVARVYATRKSSALYIKSAFPLFVAVLVAWCGFFIRPKDASPRVSVSVGALFAAAAGTVAINSQLPDIEYPTLTDKTVFLSLAMILLSLIGTVCALGFHYSDRERSHRRLDRVGSIVYPVVYLVSLLILLR